jgi:hypothetical protein
MAHKDHMANLPHKINIALPPSQYCMEERRFVLQLDLLSDSYCLDNCEQSMRQTSCLSIPPSHKALFIHAKTKKPLLVTDSAPIDQGIRDGDTLRLLFFPSSWAG